MIAARNNSNTPSTAIPSNLNGNDSSQNSGYRQSASNAKGQHMMSKIKNRRKFNIVSSDQYLYEQMIAKEYADGGRNHQAYRSDQQSIHVFIQFHDILLISVRLRNLIIRNQSDVATLDWSADKSQHDAMSCQSVGPVGNEAR